MYVTNDPNLGKSQNTTSKIKQTFFLKIGAKINSRACF